MFMAIAHILCEQKLMGILKENLIACSMKMSHFGLCQMKEVRVFPKNSQMTA